LFEPKSKLPMEDINIPINANKNTIPATIIPSIIVEIIQPRPVLFVLVDLVPRLREDVAMSGVFSSLFVGGCELFIFFGICLK